MEINTLPAKQKRVKDWVEFTRHIEDKLLRAQSEGLLNQLKQLLAKCGDAQAISTEDERAIVDYERQLEQLNEEARLRISTHTSIVKRGERDSYHAA